MYEYFFGFKLKLLTLRFPEEKDPGNLKFGWKVSKTWLKIVVVTVRNRVLPVNMTLIEAH
jgi:hypothetical protein